jgi:hypothetical protein
MQVAYLLTNTARFLKLATPRNQIPTFADKKARSHQRKLETQVKQLSDR